MAGHSKHLRGPEPYQSCPWLCYWHLTALEKLHAQLQLQHLKTLKVLVTEIVLYNTHASYHFDIYVSTASFSFCNYIYVLVIPQYECNILVITQVRGEAEDAGDN